MDIGGRRGLPEVMDVELSGSYDESEACSLFDLLSQG